jgi:hypothetical protein
MRIGPLLKIVTFVPATRSSLILKRETFRPAPQDNQERRRIQEPTRFATISRAERRLYSRRQIV